MFVDRGWDNGNLEWSMAVSLFKCVIYNLTGTCECGSSGDYYNTDMNRDRNTFYGALRVLGRPHGAKQRDLKVVTSDV